MSSDADPRENPDEQQGDPPPLKPTTPPSDVRTDPQRGTGEMGTEGLDPLEPLP